MQETYARLRELMLANSPGMRVARDGEGGLLLLAPWPHPTKPKDPIMFGSVRAGKAYISYHLMPLYMNVAMTAKVGPALKKRMQGKTCFNFKTPDEALFADLAELTRICAKAYEKPLTMAQMIEAAGLAP
jgi:hypothetical protein